MTTPVGIIRFTDVRNLMPGTFTIFGLSHMRNFNLKTPQIGIIRISNVRNQYPFPTINAPPSSLQACYSVRKINPNYNGPIFRLTRGNDAVSADFFSDNRQSYLTTGNNNTGTTYASWIGANIAYVTIWYDQSGSNFNASNNFTNATRPYITSESGKYLLYYISINCNILSPTTGFQTNTIFCNWCNINGNYGSIVGHQYSSGQRFGVPGATRINGNSVRPDDWFFSCTGTKLSYVNGNSTVNITLNQWMCLSLSYQTPPVYNPVALFSKIGTDGLTSATSTFNRGVTGKIAEIFFHNKTVAVSDIIAYNQNKLF